MTGAPLARIVLSGVAALVDGMVDEARAHFDESLRLAIGTGRISEGQALQGLAAAAASGDPVEVATPFTDSLTHLYRTRFWIYVWIVMENLAIYWVDSGDLEGGAVLLGHLEAHEHAYEGVRRRAPPVPRPAHDRPPMDRTHATWRTHEPR